MYKQHETGLDITRASSESRIRRAQEFRVAKFISNIIPLIGDLEDGYLDIFTNPACVDENSEDFFADRGGGYKNAKSVCEGCINRDECLQYALDNDIDIGIWGGLTPNERKALSAENGEAKDESES